MVPAFSPSTDTGITTMAHEARGSKPCSAPMATERPRSRISRDNGPPPTAARGWSTPNGPSPPRRRQWPSGTGPRRRRCSAWSPGRMDTKAERPASTNESATRSPVEDAGPDTMPSEMPSTWAARCRLAAARRSSDVSSCSSTDCFSTAPSARTTTRRARADPSPTSCIERMVAASWEGPTDHGRAVGQVGQQAAGPPEHLFHLAVDVGEELPDLLALDGPQGPGPPRWSTKNRYPLSVGIRPALGVGLGQVAIPLERGHLAPHRGRGHALHRDCRRYAGDPTGRAVSMYSDTTAFKMAALRASTRGLVPVRLVELWVVSTHHGSSLRLSGRSPTGQRGLAGPGSWVRSLALHSTEC